MQLPYRQDNNNSNYGIHIGPSFQLDRGVPQRACLSPTLYSFCTHDMPKPQQNTYYIAFADDITHLTSDAARNTTNAIQHINAYENRWKIKTNKNKFLIIPISRLNTADIFIKNDSLRYTAEGKFGGLSFHSRGISPQITNRKALVLPIWGIIMP